MRKTLLAAAASLLLCAVSCTVKEDRSVCPCMLSVRFLDGLPMAGQVCVGVFPDGGEDAAVVRMYTQKEYEAGRTISAPRGWATVTAFCGIENYTVNTEKDLELYYSLQSDPVYAFTRRVNLQGDSMTVEEEGHKQYAHLTVYVTNGPANCATRFSSDVGGFSMHTMEPVAGRFYVHMPGRAAGDGRRVFECEIPRQLDYTSTLSVYEMGSDLDRPVKTVQIGEMMQQAGISFADEDQGDITVTVDFSEGKVTVGINDWSSTVTQHERM